MGQSADTPEDARLAAVATLGRALLNVTLIQVLGYMMKKHKLIPPTALPGAGAFIGLVSLPAIYFRAVATLDFSTVRGEVLVALIVGKLILVALSVQLGRMTKSAEPGCAEMLGGVFALLTTNSDDLGLGLPVMGALFPKELVSMCYVLNATQAMVFNPQIFMLLGCGAARRDAAAAGAAPAPTSVVILSVLRGLTRNFLILAVVSGLAWNVALGGGRGCALPFFLESLCALLGAAFGPIVLFLGGAANVGAFEQLGALHSVLMPLLTVLLKVLVLPTFVAAATGWLGGARETADFAFAFSTLPSAASTLVFAAPYQPSGAMASLMNASLLLHKVVGFPVLFLAAAVFTTSDATELVAVEAAVGADTQALCLALTLLLVLSRAWYAGWSLPPLQHMYGLLVLTLGFYVAALGGAWLMATPVAHKPAWTNLAAFVATSVFRWAADATVILCAFAAMRVARARLRLAQAQAAARGASHATGLVATGLAAGGGLRGGKGVELAAPLVVRTASASPRAMRGAEFGAAAVAGLALTLPWALTMPYPEQHHLDHMLPLWVPYDESSQPLVYALVYAAAALSLLVCSGLMITSDAQATELIGGKRSWKLLRLRRTHSFLVRYEAFLFLTATRCALASAICAGLYVGRGTELTGSVATMLLVASLLANSSGLVLFFLFGTSEGVFVAPMHWLVACARRGGSGGGGGGGGVSRRSLDLTEAKVQEANERNAAGAGYEEDVPTAAQERRSEAGEKLVLWWSKTAARRRAAAAQKRKGFFNL